MPGFFPKPEGRLHSTAGPAVTAAAKAPLLSLSNDLTTHCEMETQFVLLSAQLQ
jgi:hypothetical protein